MTSLDPQWHQISQVLGHFIEVNFLAVPVESIHFRGFH